MRKVKEDILRLRAAGKSYGEIAKELDCSRGVISYHCGEGQKLKTRERTLKNYASHLISRKIHRFKTGDGRTAHKPRTNATTPPSHWLNSRIGFFRIKAAKMNEKPENQESLTRTAFYKKFGRQTTNCYLSGRAIDLNNPASFTLDHIVPVCKGGVGTLENCGVTVPAANQAKGELSVAEFVLLCQDVLAHQGYKVIPPK